MEDKEVGVERFSNAGGWGELEPSSIVPETFGRETGSGVLRLLNTLRALP